MALDLDLAPENVLCIQVNDGALGDDFDRDVPTGSSIDGAVDPCVDALPQQLSKFEIDLLPHFTININN